MTPDEKGEQEILARIRTLLALERNFLAEERTALADLRTGLTLALIGPPASAAVAYFISVFPLKIILFDVLNIMFFSALTIIGIRMCLRSQSELKQTRQKKKLLRAREAELVKNSKVAQDLLGDFLSLEKDWRGHLASFEKNKCA